MNNLDKRRESNKLKNFEDFVEIKGIRREKKKNVFNEGLFLAVCQDTRNTSFAFSSSRVDTQNLYNT